MARKYGNNYSKYKPRYKRPAKPMRYKVADMAYSAYKTANRLKGIINSEKKVHDVTSTAAISTTAAVTCLLNIPQGDDYNNREGRSILLKSLECKGRWVHNDSAGTTTIRMLLFQDNGTRDSGSDFPTISQLLTSSDPMALRNPDPVQFRRFKVLMDKRVSLTNEFPTHNFDKYFKLNHHVKYSGSDSADAAQGSIWVLLLSNESTNTPLNLINWRIRFYDN